MDKYLSYLDTAIEALNRIKQTQQKNINDAVNLMFERFQKGGAMFAFGAGHAGIIAEEMFCRAGGLVVMNPIFNPTLMLNTRPFSITSAMERMEGFGQIILEGSPVKPGDVLIIHSVSGRNSVTIDMAKKAREMDVGVIVITGLEYSKNIPSRHSCGKNLYEFADIVIDNCGTYGDASVTLDESGVIAGPTSTVSGAAIANMLSVGFAELCDKNDIRPPVFISANLDADRTATEQTMQKYMDRIHYM